mgnify:FL=1
MMNHDKQQRVAEETAISERFVRRVNPFRQVFPHQQLNQRVTDKTGQRTGKRMHSGRI